MIYPIPKKYEKKMEPIHCGQCLQEKICWIFTISVKNVMK